MGEMKINISDNLVDQRARAKALLDALPVIFTCSQYGSVQLCKEAEAECLDTILTALADERRRVGEEAAKICDERAKYYRSIKSVGDIHDRVVGRLADEIRAKAQAGEEA